MLFSSIFTTNRGEEQNIFLLILCSPCIHLFLRHVKTLFLFYWYHTIFQSFFYPKRTIQTDQKSWMKKYLYSKMFSCLFQAWSNSLHLLHWFQKQTYHWVWCPQSLCMLCASRLMLCACSANHAWSVHWLYRVLRHHVMYAFGIITTNTVIWNMF